MRRRNEEAAWRKDQWGTSWARRSKYNRIYLFRAIGTITFSGALIVGHTGFGVHSTHSSMARSTSFADHNESIQSSIRCLSTNPQLSTLLPFSHSFQPTWPQILTDLDIAFRPVLHLTIIYMEAPKIRRGHPQDKPKAVRVQNWASLFRPSAVEATKVCFWEYGIQPIHDNLYLPIPLCWTILCLSNEQTYETPNVPS